MGRSLTFSEAVALVRDQRFLVVFLLGFSSGLPWALHGSVLTLWMQESGQSRSAIGYIGAVAAIYALNWMWSPLVDKLRLPVFHRLFGQRRAWILFTQALMAVSLLMLSQADPAEHLVYLGLCALALSFCSATQDIAVDSYRIKLFSRREMDTKMPFSAAVTTAGWLSGYGFIGGALALWLGGEQIGLSWSSVYQVMALVYLLLMLLVSLCPEPELWEDDNEEALAQPEQHWFRATLITPFTEFFRRCGWSLALGILVFLFSFRLGEAMLGRMSLVFYVELGFTTDQIALYQKFFGGLVTVCFSFLGAFINSRYGIIRGMLVGGIAMASSNLLYAVMAQVGPEPAMFMITLLIDNFTQAFATVAVISFMSYFASRTYTGTQFALMTSISNFGRTTLAAGSGVVIDSLGGNWTLFFILTTIAVIPSLLILLWLGRRIEAHDLKQRASQSPD